LHPLEQDLDHVLEHTAAIWTAMRGERMFITGGTGFVGTWLVESFLWANRKLNLGAKAVVLSRRPRVAADASVEYLTGDGASFHYPDGAFPFVIHGANDASFAVNVKTAERVSEFAQEQGTKRFLFTSSGAAYGPQPRDMTHLSETNDGEPVTSYGQAKRASEPLCQNAGAVIARLFAFVGPYLPLDASFAVGNFIGNVLRGEPVHVSGDGTPYRSYLYAADLAIWLWTMLLKGEPGRTYNVGSAAAVNIAALAETVVRNTRPDTPIVITSSPQKGSLPERYVPSVARAEEELGLRVLIELGDGIRRTYNWHLR
jgi:dTDP-glucose 4,6-dehydratase